MDKIFTFDFDDGQIFMNGLFSLKKIKQKYNANYDYFKINFNEGNLCIKDRYNNKLIQYDLKNIQSAIALKREYLKKESLNTNEYISFSNIKDRDVTNNYDLYIVNVDINNILEEKYVLKGLLRDKLKYIFIGNEGNLLRAI